MKTSTLSLFVFLALNLTGCATSLKTQVFKDIHVGETKEEVVSKLGEPIAFRPSQKDPSLDVLFYIKKADLCEIEFREDKVEETACQPNPNYVSIGQAIAMTLQGMGQGIQEAGRTPIEPKQSFTCIGNSTMVNCN